MSVPIASVHEDARAVSQQHYVGLARQSGVVESVSEPTRPQVSAYHHLRLRILAVDGCHAAVPLLWGEVVHAFTYYSISPITTGTVIGKPPLFV